MCREPWPQTAGHYNRNRERLLPPLPLRSLLWIARQPGISKLDEPLCGHPVVYIGEAGRPAVGAAVFLPRLARTSGREMPTREDLVRRDRTRKKRASNKEWKSPSDEDAGVAKMKDALGFSNVPILEVYLSHLSVGSYDPLIAELDICTTVSHPSSSRSKAALCMSTSIAFADDRIDFLRRKKDETSHPNACIINIVGTFAPAPKQNIKTAAGGAELPCQIGHRHECAILRKAIIVFHQSSSWCVRRVAAVPPVTIYAEQCLAEALQPKYFVRSQEISGRAKGAMQHAAIGYPSPTPPPRGMISLARWKPVRPAMPRFIGNNHQAKDNSCLAFR